MSLFERLTDLKEKVTVAATNLITAAEYLCKESISSNTELSASNNQLSYKEACREIEFEMKKPFQTPDIRLEDVVTSKDISDTSNTEMCLSNVMQVVRNAMLNHYSQQSRFKKSINRKSKLKRVFNYITGNTFFGIDSQINRICSKESYSPRANIQALTRRQKILAKKIAHSLEPHMTERLERFRKVSDELETVCPEFKITRESAFASQITTTLNKLLTDYVIQSSTEVRSDVQQNYQVPTTQSLEINNKPYRRHALPKREIVCKNTNTRQLLEAAKEAVSNFNSVEMGLAKNQSYVSRLSNLKSTLGIRLELQEYVSQVCKSKGLSKSDSTAISAIAEGLQPYATRGLRLYASEKILEGSRVKQVDVEDAVSLIGNSFLENIDVALVASKTNQYARRNAKEIILASMNSESLNPDHNVPLRTPGKLMRPNAHPKFKPAYLF